MKEIVYVEVVVWCVLILVTENVSVYLSHSSRSGWRQPSVMMKHIDFSVVATWFQIHSLHDRMTLCRLLRISLSLIFFKEMIMEFAS